MSHQVVKGIYEHLDCMLTGVDRLKKAGFTGFQVVAPLPRHEIEEAMYEGRPSPVRWWTMTGAILGITGGIILTSLTHAHWPMINPGGKPVVSLPPFVIILFEPTILLGSFFTLAGFLFHSRLPSFFLPKSMQDPRTTDASFSIVFTEAREADSQRIQEILNGSGAVEVTTGENTTYEVPNA